MKCKRWIALLLALLMLSGCASETTVYAPPPVETPFYEEESMPEMGEIYLTVDEVNDQEYSDATVRLDWTESSIEETEITIKLRGNSSKLVDKKSYNIKFDEKVDLMNMGKGKKWSLLASPFDQSLMRVGLAFEYAEALGLPYVSKYRFCKLWLNDTYMGIYIAIEPIGDGADRIDIDVENGDAIVECDLNRVEEGITYITAKPDIRMQVNEPDPPTRREAEKIEDFLNKVYRAVKSKDHTKYEKVIDVDSFVNFYIFNEVVKDVDFGEFSTRYYIRDGKLYAGPPWDLDLSMGNVSQYEDEIKYYRYHNSHGYGNASEDSTEDLWVMGNYYEWLMDDTYFRDLVFARWQEMLPVTQNLFEENELGESLMDRYLAAYEADFLSNYGAENTGWVLGRQDGQYADQSVSPNYEDNVEELREWLTKRVAWLDAELGTNK